MKNCCSGKDVFAPTPAPATAGHVHGHDHGGTTDMSGCCAMPSDKQRPDYLLWGSGSIIIAGVSAHLICNSLDITAPLVHHFGHAVLDLVSMMWWGVILGLVVVGLMSRVPREYFTAMLGRGDSVGGIFRAAAAGLLLDLCSHGILMVGAKLYERGASLGQVMTFLIASPWNSFSLTLILIAMVGFKWTLVFILASAVIAIVTGFMYLALTRAGILPENPNKTDLPDGFNMMADAKARLKHFKFTRGFAADVLRHGWMDGKMVLRWLAFGIVLAALIRTFVPMDTFATWFGPTIAGLFLTLLATTLIEVCSEGSTPIGADLVTRAAAPGNGFAFLMAGVSTDYTEMMVLRDMTKSWKIALSLPLLTVPQILVLGWIMNQFGAGG